MKKILYLFLLPFALACSNDDNANYDVLKSEVLVNGEAFVPLQLYESTPKAWITTVDAIEEDKKQTTLSLRHQSDIASENQVLQFYLIYPENQAKISGTYQLDGGVDRRASVTFNADDKFYNSVSGSIKVTDLGQSRYKVETSGVLLWDSEGNAIPLSGKVSGPFTQQ